MSESNQLITTLSDRRGNRESEAKGYLPTDDLKISLISTIIMLLISIPFFAARLLGVPLIRDPFFEASIVYLPLIVLILLTLYQRWRNGKTQNLEEQALGSPSH